jgi:L-threonylcarbamoyladenylate synthase
MQTSTSHQIKLLDGKLVERCVEVIQAGELIIFPTETIYGIGGSAVDIRAWERLRQLKPERTKSFTYLVAGWEMTEPNIQGDLNHIHRIMDKLCPGPVTLVCQASNRIEKPFANPDGSLAVRCPGIDRIRETIKASGVPWLHTSANLSGQPPVRLLRKVNPKVLSAASLAIDSGMTALGGQSTVLDLRVSPFRILRKGILTEKQIRDAIDIN